jgi:hypothetical protein
MLYTEKVYIETRRDVYMCLSTVSVKIVCENYLEKFVWATKSQVLEADVC